MFSFQGLRLSSSYTRRRQGSGWEWTQTCTSPKLRPTPDTGPFHGWGAQMLSETRSGWPRQKKKLLVDVTSNHIYTSYIIIWNPQRMIPLWGLSLWANFKSCCIYKYHCPELSWSQFILSHFLKYFPEKNETQLYSRNIKCREQQWHWFYYRIHLLFL